MSMVFIPLIAVASFSVARIQENTGSYLPGFLGMAVMVMISFAVSLLLRERRDPGPNQSEIANRTEPVGPGKLRLPRGRYDRVAVMAP